MLVELLQSAMAGVVAFVVLAGVALLFKAATSDEQEKGKKE